VQQLLDAGWHPGIISRGFGGSKTAIPQAVHETTSTDEVGDEAVLMAHRRLCPVWVGHNRPAAAQQLLLVHPECNVIISDDGLQHYRLQRDVEIIVVDGVRRFGNGCLLPAGPLREDISRLKSVDAVVINGGEVNRNEYRMQLEGVVFYNLLDPIITRRASDFSRQRIHAIAGIGHPLRFFEHLNTLGLAGQAHPFSDHHRFTADDLDFSGVDALLMTEKDAVKCRSFATEKCWVLRVEAILDPSLTRLILERLVPDGRKIA
jgi:tetraacyldisaccharide 4'-kinase